MEIGRLVVKLPFVSVGLIVSAALWLLGHTNEGNEVFVASIILQFVYLIGRFFI